MKRHFYIFTEFQETVYFAFFFSPFLSITSKPICLLPILRAVYPDVSLSLKICAQRKEKKEGRKEGENRLFLVPMVPCVSSPVTRMSLAFGTRIYAKNETPEEEAEGLQFYLFLAVASYAKLPWLIQY